MHLAMVAWLTVAAFLPVGVLKAQQAEDPHGWTAAKWGMKESDVKALFPEGVMIDDSRGKLLGLRGLQISKLTYTVKFVFDKTGLRIVELSPEGERAIVANVAQGQLLGMLKDKYGTPNAPKDEEFRGPPGKQHTWEWTLPDTVINLSFGDYLDLKFNFVFLVYHKRVKSDVL